MGQSKHMCANTYGDMRVDLHTCMCRQPTLLPASAANPNPVFRSVSTDAGSGGGLVAKSCPVLVTPRLQLPGFCPWDSPGMRTHQFLGTAHAQEETTPSPCLQELIPYRRLRKGHKTRQSTADHKKGLVRQQSGLAGRSQTPPWGRQTHAGSSFMGEKVKSQGAGRQDILGRGNSKGKKDTQQKNGSYSSRWMVR